MVDDSDFREPEPATGDPYGSPADAVPPAATRGKGELILRIVEWTLGAPLVLLGLAQCGVATLFLSLSFVIEVGFPRSLMALLFSNGLMLVVPGALLCLGRSWAAWFVLIFGLVSLGLGLAATRVPFLVFGGLLAVFATAVLILAEIVRRSGR
jgi:hypothetical protein